MVILMANSMNTTETSCQVFQQFWPPVCVCVLYIYILTNESFGAARLPEGVAEVNAPALQLLGVVRRHVGKLAEDVQIRGVAWKNMGVFKRQEIK